MCVPAMRWIERRVNAYWDWRQFVATAELARIRWRAALRQEIATSVAPPFGKVFVAGCPRSGTTWIGSMLRAHPAVVGNGESHAYPQILDVVTELGLKGDAVWRHVLYRYDRMRARGLGPGLHRYVDRDTLLRVIATAT